MYMYIMVLCMWPTCTCPCDLMLTPVMIHVSLQRLFDIRYHVHVHVPLTEESSELNAIPRTHHQSQSDVTYIHTYIHTHIHTHIHTYLSEEVFGVSWWLADDREKTFRGHVFSSHWILVPSNRVPTQGHISCNMCICVLTVCVCMCECMCVLTQCVFV